MRELLELTASVAADYLEPLREPVFPAVRPDELRAALGAAEPGIVATGSGRYFGFVIGGGLPAALAADWLATEVGWDVGQDPLHGAPRVRVLAGAKRHVTLDRALRCSASARRRRGVRAGPDARRRSFRAIAGGEGPTIVCAQGAQAEPAPLPSSHGGSASR